MNKGAVYALWHYEAQSPDELSFHEGDALTVLRRRDDSETEWWWARLNDKEGYVPRNLLGVSRVSAFRPRATRATTVAVVILPLWRDSEFGNESDKAVSEASWMTRVKTRS